MSSDLSNFAARLCTSKASSACKAFDELARELFVLQFAHNAPYRRLCEARGISPKNISHWSEIPSCPTAAFKEFETTSLAREEREFVFYSSGTTRNSRSRHFHSIESMAIYEMSLLAWVQPHLFQDRQRIRILSLTPSPADAPNSSLVHMFGAIERAHGLHGSIFAGRIGSEGEWDLDFEAIQQFLAEHSRDDVLLAGTAFNCVQLIDYLKERGIHYRLSEGSRIIETGGYKGRSRVVPKSELYSMMCEYLNVPDSSIVSEYGMSELSSQAYDRAVSDAKDERAYRFPPWARVQIVSPENGRPIPAGQSGLIRVFDLANVWSVMAIQTEDVGVERADGGFELLGRNAIAEPRGCSLMTA